MRIKTKSAASPKIYRIGKVGVPSTTPMKTPKIGVKSMKLRKPKI